MIGIQLEDDTDFLETKPETSITLRLENPILGTPEKLSPGSFSLPFDLPGGESSPSNAAKLKNPDVMENSIYYAVQRARLFWGGNPLKSGKLKSLGSNSKDIISNYFTFGLNSISEDLKKAKLRTIINENVTITTHNINKKVYVKRTTAGDITLILNGNSFGPFPNTSIGRIDLATATATAAFTLTLDNPDAWAPRVIAANPVGDTPGGMTPDYFTVGLTQYYTVSPGVYAENAPTDPNLLMQVQVDTPADYQLESDLGTYYDDYKTFIENYIDGTYPHAGLRFPVVFNADLYDGKAVKDGEGINLIGPDGLIENDPNFGSSLVKNYNSIQPFLLVKYVLDRIAGVFDFEFDGDFYNDAEVANLLIWNSHTLDIIQNYIGDSPFIFWQPNFNTKDLVPDIGVIDFLKALQSRYNLAVFFNENTGKVQMSYREVVAKTTVYEDITPISSPITNYKNERVEGFTMTVEEDDTDDFSLKEEFLVGLKGEEPIDIHCGRLFQSGSKLVNGELVQGPRVSQPMGEKFQFRVFHYKGIIEKTTFDYAGADISGPDFDETLTGVHNAFHQYWLLFQRNRMVIKVETDYVFRNLQRYNFELKRRFDRSNYLVKSIEFQLTNEKITASTVELYSMK